MRLTRVTVFLAALVAVVAPAQAEEINNAAEYRRCMDLTKTNAKKAFDDAINWEGLGGGEAAKHCAAVALWNLGETAEAARRLQALADTSGQELALRIGKYNQAGLAWLEAGETDKAYAAQSQAIALDPENAGLYYDRAVVTATAADYGAALGDIEKALELDPQWSDAWVLRGAAHRFLDDLPQALSDLNKALFLAPGHAEGLLERGIVHRLNGDNDAARRDWSKLLSLTPEGPAADAARANLQILELGVEPN